MSGRVEVGGRVADKPGSRVASDAAVQVRGPIHPYVGRGGMKLAGALDAFGLDVSGLTVVDVGASTGGFTDCLLRRGAARVFAVDVGKGQLDWKLRSDPRVILREGINARHLTRAQLPGLGAGADLATIDVSFISLRLILPPVAALLRPDDAAILALVKPQFEVGRGLVGKGGIVRDPRLRAQAVAAVGRHACEEGLGVAGMTRSPVAGAEGNLEYFILMRGRPGGLSPLEIEEHAARLAEEA